MHADYVLLAILLLGRATQLAQILGKHLVAIEKSSTAMEAKDIAVDNNMIPNHISSMARTLTNQQKRDGLVWSLEVMAVINSWATSLTFEMLRIIASSVKDIDTRLEIVEGKTLSRDTLPSQVNNLEASMNDLITAPESIQTLATDWIAWTDMSKPSSRPEWRQQTALHQNRLTSSQHNWMP